VKPTPPPPPAPQQSSRPTTEEYVDIDWVHGRSESSDVCSVHEVKKMLNPFPEIIGKFYGQSVKAFRFFSTV